MMKSLLIGLAALVLLAGCGMLSAPAAEQPTAIPTLTPAVPATVNPLATPAPALGGKQSGDYLVWLFNAPHPPVRGTNLLEALITDAAGQPVSDATVSFDLDMTNMSHGKNVVAASAVGAGGYYSGEAHFLMPGPWRVIVNIERAGKTSSVRFDFMVSR